MTETMMTCNACGRSVPESLIAERNRHNTGGDTICLPCHIECITSGWHQRPRDAGQTVDITYAVDWESETLYQRFRDRSDGETTIQAARIIDGEFQPWNGVLPIVAQWRTV
jgi:hypothetical protein